ncbi:hypothetical protein NECAME_07908 [Necator americanus]|uniref:Uncharacterized protein n=1 Tax=Necator americanus TaxID=51031 RepID=W2TND9_NECAM|nr:hypothetical protein NECAME_07908 [Necator americanus]ETN82522.1 hypothetical protein NECAME_07908 [Necator americanus]
MLVFLLYMNVRLTQLLQGGNGRLSTRYQLIENIKILRLLVPVVVFDTTVCAVDLIGAVFFNIQPAFNKIDCSNNFNLYGMVYTNFHNLSAAHTCALQHLLKENEN